ncbi:2920_t:CDS:1 [Dentiscutata erythropus]|uniref:2920_t:CDS:1 n=1 Tax=Dentiscutata erythropus TaxID=1348616 RepID=A0A9N9BCF4_9GLOM|nr:2920_t:CDS:1 [Dentiscutata erythropus]
MNNDSSKILQGQNVDKVIQHSNAQLQFELVETAIYHDADFHDWKTTKSSSEYPDLIDFTSHEGHNSDTLPSEISISLRELIGSIKKNDNDHNNSETIQDTVTKITPTSQKSTSDISSTVGESSKDQTFNEAKKAIQLWKKNEEICKGSQIIKSPNSAEIFKVSSQEEIKARKAALNDSQEKIRAWVLKVWPRPRTLGIRQMTEGLTACNLKKRSLNPLVVGVNIITQSKPMVLTATVTGTKYSRIDNCHKPKIVMDILDLRQYILKHCPTYQYPPIKNNSDSWDDIYFLKEILPKLTEEAINVQNQPGLLLTVKEVIIRGLEGNPLFECKLCAENTSYYSNSRFFNLKGIYKHLESSRHKIHFHNVYDYHIEDFIQVNPKEYVLAFCKELPPKIFSLEKKH